MSEYCTPLSLSLSPSALPGIYVYIMLSFSQDLFLPPLHLLKLPVTYPNENLLSLAVYHLSRIILQSTAFFPLVIHHEPPMSRILSLMFIQLLCVPFSVPHPLHASMSLFIPPVLCCIVC